MFYILIVGIVMAIISAVFWCVETMPCVHALKRLQPPSQSRNPIKVVSESLRYITGFMGAFTKLWPLAIDLICTIWLCGSFGFSGMIGGVIGLTVSNVISIFLIYISRN